MIIEKEGCGFDVDLDETKKYYNSNEVCDCLPCQNFYAQAKEKFKKLDQFLSEFGVDILRPDETSWIETDDELEYIDITYTICGKILKGGGYKIDIYDSLFLSVMINDKYIPNNHKAENWFSLTVFNVKLPWVIENNNGK